MSKFLRPLAATAGCAVALSMMLASPARALTDSETACRKAVAKAMGKYFKASNKAILSCHKNRDSGKIPGAADCNDYSVADSFSGQKATAAWNAADAVINGSLCASAPGILAAFGRCPAPYEAVDDLGPTTGIDSFPELSSCLAYHSIELISNAASKVLGLPAPPLSKELGKCHAAIGKGYAKIVNTSIKARAKCQTALDGNGGSLGFPCVLDDASGKIAKARTKAQDGINKACTVVSASLVAGKARASGVPELDSCAVQLDDVIVCALDEAADAAGTGMSAMMWELPGICPAAGSYIVIPVATQTEVDVGWTGHVHDMDPILGYRGAQFTISCDADCANCVTTAVGPAEGACRCNGDASVVCETNPDCAGLGGTCECFYGPPTPYMGAGNPACVLSRLTGTMTGNLDPQTGDVSLELPLLHRIYLGISLSGPCPKCTLGVCAGGARNGLACNVDATDDTFGAVSYDCPPSPASNISGPGLATELELTTGSASLPFATQCSAPLGAYACACAQCSGNTTIACRSNADCAAVGAGNCTSSTGGPRHPNSCNDLVCSPDVDPEEGTCLAGPIDTYCDGFVRSSGEGMITCTSNSDCDTIASECPNNDCGNCSLTKRRDCFLDPIDAQGTPGETIVGVGCVGPTFSAGVNAAVGWPGAYRVRQNLAAELVCPDGATPYFPPGGSNCP